MKIKLPSDFKICEDCENFLALTRDRKVLCQEWGQINGVVVCVRKKEKKDDDERIHS